MAKDIKEDITEEESESIQKSKAYMHSKREAPKNVIPPLRTTDDYNNYMIKLAETRKRQEIEIMLSATMKLCENNAHKNPFPSPYDLMIAKTNPSLKQTYPLAELNEKIQNLKDFMEDITESENIETESINEEARIYCEKTGSIKRINQVGNASLERREWAGFVEEVKANLLVLKIGKRICQPILDSYLAEIARRNDPKKISQIIGKLTDLVKHAEKIKPIITKSNKKAEETIAKGRNVEPKTCSKYIDALTEFNELQNQYSNLSNELKFYTNEPLKIPEFPDLAVTEISADYTIKKTWKNYG